MMPDKCHPCPRTPVTHVPGLNTIEQGRVLNHPVLKEIAKRHHATVAQVALAWVIRSDGVNAIPKAGTPEHVRENRGAVDIHLSKRDLEEIDRAFPAPTRKRPLEMI